MGRLSPSAPQPHALLCVPCRTGSEGPVGLVPRSKQSGQGGVVWGGGS